MAEYLLYIVSSEGQSVTSMSKCISNNYNAEADTIVQITLMNNSAEYQSWSQAAVGEIASSLGSLLRLYYFKTKICNNRRGYSTHT